MQPDPEPNSEEEEKKRNFAELSPYSTTLESRERERKSLILSGSDAVYRKDGREGYSIAAADSTEKKLEACLELRLGRMKTNELADKASFRCRLVEGRNHTRGQELSAWSHVLTL